MNDSGIRESVRKAFELLQTSDFHDDAHQTIWQHLRKMHREGVPADPTLLVDRLKGAGHYEPIGGPAYIGKILHSVTNAAHVAHYSQVVAEKGARRRAIFESTERIRAAFDESRPLDAAPAAAPMFKVVDADELFTTNYQIRWLVRGMIAKLQPGLIAGPKKALKTSIGEDLSVSMAVGAPFLGKWEVERARVLFCSAESGEATISETAKRIAESKGIDWSDLKGWLFHCWSVPLLDNDQHLEEFRKMLRACQPEVIICDPAYLMFSGNADAANLFSMGARLRALNELCQEFEATILLVHHFKKGRAESDTPQLEDIAYAGFQEHCRQWLMLDREGEYRPGSGEHNLVMSWGGSAGQSGEVSLTVSEGVNDGFGGERFWATEVLDRKAKEERKAETKTKAEQQKERAARDKIDSAFISASGQPLTAKKLAERCGCDQRQAAHVAALGAMLREGKIESVVVNLAGNNKPCDAYVRHWGKNEQPESAA